MAEERRIPLPRENSDLIGHEAAERLLASAFASGRIPHAWLITGPTGIGKATLAYRFARYALAGGAPADEGPGLFGDSVPAATGEGLWLDPATPVFRQIAAGSHPDLLAIERGYDEKRKRMRGEIVVDDVRQLGHFMRLTPSLGGWRIVVIDSADEMNRNAANAILKLLEEPPRKALLLLVSHAPGRLLPTIRSRCRTLRLSPLGEAEMHQLLERHAPEAAPEAREALIAISEGSIGRALALAGGGGIAALEDIVALFAGFPAVDAVRLHEVADRWTRSAKEEEGDPLAVGLDMLHWWIGRAARIAAAGAPAVEVVPGERRAAERLIAVLGPAGASQRLTALRAIAGRGDGLNLDRRQILFDSVFALSPAHSPTA